MVANNQEPLIDLIVAIKSNSNTPQSLVSFTGPNEST